jgi:hypothetical protein
MVPSKPHGTFECCNWWKLVDYYTSKNEQFHKASRNIRVLHTMEMRQNKMAHASTSFLRYLSYEARRAHGSLVDSGADADINQKYVRLSNTYCDYYGSVERATWLDHS